MRTTSLLPTLLLMLGLGMASSAIAQAPPPPPPDTQETENSGPVFTTILEEGKRVVPTPQEQYEAEQAKRQEAATESVRAAADNLKRIGLFAAEAVMALMIAGVIGALIALSYTWLRARRRRK